MKRYLTILVALSMLMTGCSFLSEQPHTNITATPTHTTAESSTPLKNTLYSLDIQNSNALVNTYSANAQAEFNSVYPQLVARWAANPTTAPRTVTLRYVKNLGAAAETSASTIRVDLDYAHANPYDPGVITHELTHIVQGYPTYVVWLTEAIANYSSQLYGPRREETLRSASKYIANTTYTSDPYDTGSRFLFWIAQHKRSNVVDKLNRLLQANQYTPDSFKQLTGQTLDQLWAEYQADGGNVFTIQNKTPHQIYTSLARLAPTLNTPLTSNEAAHWETILGKANNCGFLDGSYIISNTVAHTLQQCARMITTGHNFAYQVEMKIMQGDSGGIIGRGSNTSSLSFRVGTDGTFDLVDGKKTLIAQTSSAIKQGKNTNILLMVVENKTIDLYVNGTYLGTASDTMTGGGYFGLMAVNFGHTTSVAYKSIKIWQW